MNIQQYGIVYSYLSGFGGVQLVYKKHLCPNDNLLTNSESHKLTFILSWIHVATGCNKGRGVYTRPKVIRFPIHVLLSKTWHYPYIHSWQKLEQNFTQVCKCRKLCTIVQIFYTSTKSTVLFTRTLLTSIRWQFSRLSKIVHMRLIMCKGFNASTSLSTPFRLAIDNRNSIWWYLC